MSLVPMSKVRVIGPKARLDAVLEELHRLEMVHLIDVEEEDFEVPALSPDERHAARADELRFLVAELEALLDLLEPDGEHTEAREDLIPGAVDTKALRAQLVEVTPGVEELRGRIEALEDEQVVLPRYVEPLRQLLPLVPELADLEEQELNLLRLDTVALVLNTDDETLVELLRDELAETVGKRFELVYRKIEESAIGCVLVFTHDDSEEVHALLGQEHVRHVALPEEYARLSLRGTVIEMEERISELPAKLKAARVELDDLLRPHEEEWRTLLAGLRAELEQLDAAVLVGETGHTFVAAYWVPKKEVNQLREELEARVGGEVVVEELQVGKYDEKMPVLMRNRRVARPFEGLVRFLDLPKPGTLDPTGLMALFLPFIFGAMVGDVVYGAVLFGIAYWMKRRFVDEGAMRDLASVMLVGSVWAIIFGFIFGEALGNLGYILLGFDRGDDVALWFYRPDNLVPLLIFAIALGATHVVLGLVLGIWQAWQERHRGELAERLGTLLAIAGVFGVAGLAVGMLPGGVITPAVAVIIVGLVLIMSAHGMMGILMGPLELIGAFGNILSYLRIAAVGVASAYLAIVANEFAFAAPLWIGVVIAAFFHALNLALAGFSPMIQSMRLHYVEFFSKFYTGGGRAFRAFGARTRVPRTAEKTLHYDTPNP
ncbi:MAG: V-type ATP synthase subunit I [Rubrobacteraceae bacterium]